MKTTPKTILSAVCEHFAMNPERMFSKLRKRELVTPRLTYLYLCREHTDMSLYDIGESIIDYRGTPYDHASVIHGHKKISGFLDIYDAQTVRDVEAIEKIMWNKTASLETMVPSFVDLVSRCEMA